MSTQQQHLVIGAFKDILQARDAVDTLRSIGIHYDQIGVAFTASQNATLNLEADLLELGVPPEEANYYEMEYRAGRIIVSVRPDNRDAEIQDVLKSRHAYNYETNRRP